MRPLLCATLGLLSIAAAACNRSASASSPIAAADKRCAAIATGPAVRSDGQVRASALKGLSYLSSASQAWTKQHRCFGCHVQAVTLETLSVAKKHQYAVSSAELAAMVQALKLGVTAGGHTTGIAFEGSAWARYDQWIGNNETAELLRYARELLAVQAPSGAINDDDRRLPVTGGTLETTFQAAQAWRQAYARTADDKWLPPLRRAEAFLAAQSAGWKAGRDVYLQDINFALLGLLASGVTRTEASAGRLIQLLHSRQNADGGWGLSPDKSDAFATGQTVYALKLAGFSDEDTAVARGIRFLVGKQDPSGAWRTYQSGQGGAEKAETMWAVLGLVTVDVASVAVSGLVDGQHVEPSMPLTVTAADNQGGGIKQLELLVDDLAVRSECGARLSHVLDTRKLAPGKHVLDLVATNARGQRSSRRFVVYAGDVFLTEIGAQFDEGTMSTVVSLRNIAPQSEASGAVELEVFTAGEGGDPKPKDKVFALSRKGQTGGLAFAWDGKGTDGKPLPRGRYVARLVFRDGAGKVRQTDSTLFFHGSEAAQRAAYAEVEGQIALRGGAGSANTVVELVDDKGRIVQSTRTTEQGNYRFKSVDGGQYKVRVKKAGFSELEQAVQAAPAAAPSKASLSW
jgi:squalene-hopene/tetraprenyl-beta-curcumene cyclase